MKNSLEKIMNGLIDYAGLFPPAKLPLDQAITEYISHFSDQRKWMLGRFIIPISQPVSYTHLTLPTNREV